MDLVPVYVFLFVVFFILVWKLVEAYQEYFGKSNKTVGDDDIGIRQDEDNHVSISNRYLPYRIKQTMMSPHERSLFESLRMVVGAQFDVYPQVNLDKIFSVSRQREYKYYLGHLRRINQKSVDFVVVNKNTQRPLLAIELDDSSHEYEDRRERDSLVEEIFKRNSFPLIRFSPGQYRAEELGVVLRKYLEPKKTE